MHKFPVPHAEGLPEGLHASAFVVHDTGGFVAVPPDAVHDPPEAVDPPKVIGTSRGPDSPPQENPIVHVDGVGAVPSWPTPPPLLLPQLPHDVSTGSLHDMPVGSSHLHAEHVALGAPSPVPPEKATELPVGHAGAPALPL